jgi:4-amino-4-deoxy-L-arabinose transferase-like glycosyltransferase
MKPVRIEPAIMALVLLLSALLRAWALAYDLPYIYHPDEPVYIAMSQRIFVTGDLNPHFFNYPTLFFYINALAYAPFFVLGRLAGILQSPSDILAPVSLAMGVTQAQMPSAVLLGRVVTACFGVGTVGLVYLVGKQIASRTAVGILAALAVAVSPVNISNSRLITPDTFVTFFIVAALLASVLVYQQGKTWQYILAGVCVGLAASSKYNGGLIVLALLLAHFLRHGKAALRQPTLYLALLFCGAGFLVATPFAVLDPSKFLNDLRFETLHYSTGHAGMEGESLQWYLSYMWNSSGLLYILAVLGILYGSFSHLKETSLLSVFPVAYFVLISSLVVRNDRTFLPLTPALFLLAAWFLVDLFGNWRAMRSKSLRRILLTAIASLAVVALAQPLLKTVADTNRLVTPNSRETARVWISDNLPPGARIALESYAPFVDPSRFAVQGIVRLIDHEAEWYSEQGFDFLVASQGMYGRFYQEPQRYGIEISQYDSLFRRFSPVMVFADGGYEVRVYGVK